MNMNTYHILFAACCFLWFNQYQVVLSEKCSRDDKSENFCVDGDKLHQTDTTGDMKFIDASNHIYYLFFMADRAKDLGSLKSISVEQVSEWLIENIEKHPVGASVLGLGISICLLSDSYSSNNAVNGLKKEYEELLSTNPDIFKTQKYYFQHMFKRTNEIRNNVVNFKSWQKIRTIAKSVVAAIFGLIGYSATDSTVKPAAYLFSGLTGASAVLDGYNWHVLHKLVERLEKTGYIV